MFLEHQIRIWSCDSEDWSNDAENTALHHRNQLFYFKLDKYVTINVFLLYFWSHNKYNI